MNWRVSVYTKEGYVQLAGEFSGLAGHRLARAECNLMRLTVYKLHSGSVAQVWTRRQRFDAVAGQLKRTEPVQDRNTTADWVRVF